jgi:hypothetical protein
MTSASMTVERRCATIMVVRFFRIPLTACRAPDSLYSFQEQNKRLLCSSDPPTLVNPIHCQDSPTGTPHLTILCPALRDSSLLPGTRFRPRTSSGMGLVPSLSHNGRRYWTGMGPGSSLDKVLGSGIPVGPSPTHMLSGSPLLNPRRGVCGWGLTSLIFSSVKESKAEVASSSNRIRGSLRMARATATRCFSPPDRRRPRSPTMVS